MMLVVQEYIRDEQEPAFYYHSDLCGNREQSRAGLSYAETEQSVRSNHLGSAAYLTNNGQVTQTLNYLPYGEDWVDIQHYMGARYSNMELYTFTGKERDFESGYHYFGARYYDSEALTGWLSVDPMMDKYPSLSPYAYCAWNPVKLVDPDGMEVVAYTKETQKKILGYMENLFGASSMFRFNKNGSLKINRKEFSNYYKTSTNDQKKILKGIDQAIRARKTVTINIQENNSKFIWKGINEEFAVDFTLDLKNNSGCTSSEYYPVLGHIISINDRGKNASSLSAGINENGEKETIVPPTSTTFVHELLDEFLNFFVTGITNENSPNVDKVDYQNTALRILGLKERDGSDHCY